MIAVDTSVVVAAFASWHEHHAAARTVVAEGARLPAQVALETYAVLTRLPPPHRAPAAIALEFLAHNFPEPILVLPAEAQRRLLDDLVAVGIAGGAAYDAQVAATAVHAEASLATLDVRALPTYRALRVDVRLLGG